MNTATIKGDSALTGAPFYFISSVREGNYGHCTFYYVGVQLCLYSTIKSEVKKKKTEKKRWWARAPGAQRVHMHTCVHTNRYGWMVFTCWTSHLCSVEMGTGHCCWSRSWHRHSARTKWRRSPINQDRRREKSETKVGRGRFGSEVLTAIYVSYCVTGVAALMKVSLSFFCVPKVRDFSLLWPLHPTTTTHTHTWPTCIFRRTATRVF